MSQKALYAVCRSELGIEPPTTLTRRVLDFFNLNSVEELLYLFTNRTKRIKKDLDGLTPMLLDEAEAGDPLARSIVREHGSALANYVQVAARRVGLESTAFALVLAGGVFRHTSSLLANKLWLPRIASTRICS